MNTGRNSEKLSKLAEGGGTGIISYSDQSTGT